MHELQLAIKVYLNEFDQWMKSLLSVYTRGTRRKDHRAYSAITQRLWKMRKRGKTEGAKALVKHRRTLPSVDPHDPDFRRLYYTRYADDFLLGLIGTKEEAHTIKRQIKDWLQGNLLLELSDEKTLITHATTDKARFLGYEVTTLIVPDRLDRHRRRATNGKISLRVPIDVVNKHCQRYLNAKRKPRHRTELLEDSDYSIVARYQQEYRGIVQYYKLAPNVCWFSRLQWVMQVSLLKTLANKHKTTVRAIARKYCTTTTTAEGKTLACLEVRVERTEKSPLVARFGGISLARQPDAILNDKLPQPRGGRTELLKRLLADTCELCGSEEHIQVHHIRKLADLQRPGRKERPQWVKTMAARRRKTLVVCWHCHQAIHAGQPTRQRQTE
jgi:hypothetical protein